MFTKVAKVTFVDQKLNKKNSLENCCWEDSD